jgi:glutaconate CoA-transferase subunit A
MILAIGGSLFHNKPMTLVREIVRRKLTRLDVISVPQASMDVDLLIAAGCTRRVRVPYLGFDHLGLAPGFRQAARNATVDIWECDETQLLAGLEASAKDVPSALVKAGVGTDLPRLNGDLKLIDDPVTGKPIIAVAAISPDVAILHAAAGDAYGNLSYAGYAFGDLLIAEATKRAGGIVIASVDELVSVAKADRDPFRTDIPHFLVDAVVEAPYGAHPCSSHGNYQQDEDGLRTYLTAVNGGAATFERYIEETVFALATQEDYLDAFVKPSTLVQMRRGIHG